MKKIFGIMVLALFILSIVPMAFAEEDSGAEPVPEMMGDAGENVADDVMAAPGPKGKNGKEVRPLDRIRERLSKAKVTQEKARERFNVAKGKYVLAKERYQEHKSELVQLKEKANVCQRDSEEEECPNLKLNLKMGVKNHLLKTSDLIERSLERLTQKIVDSETLTEEQKEDALVKINELQETLLVEKENVEALSEETTAEELRDAVKSLKGTWQDVSKGQKNHIASLMHSKTGTAVEKHGGLVNSMEARIASLEKAGADVSELAEVLDRFRDHVGLLNEDYATAKEAWQSAEDRKEVLSEWKEAQLTVRERMVGSKTILRDFITKFKELKQNLDEDLVEEVEEEETEDEVEEEDEEESEAEDEVEDEDSEGVEDEDTEEESEETEE